MNLVTSLSTDHLRTAADRRLNSLVSRYKGQVIGWDVVKENRHFSFFEDRLGRNAFGRCYKKASQIDRNTIMFMNEYNVVEKPGDTLSTPVNI